MPRWKQVLISFGIVIGVCAIYLTFFGTQTFLVLEAHRAARKLPFVKLIPIDLTDLSVSQEPGIKLSYFGYEFEVPWTDIDQEKIKIIGGNKVIIPFRSGNVLMVWSGPPHELINGLFEQGKIDRDALRKVYGDEALHSDYNFQRLILEATPDKITLFSTSKTVASQALLLMVKAMSVPGDPNSGIFTVQGKEFKGFQYGRPQTKHLNVELFPEGGHLDLFFDQKTNGPTVISQADINRVLQTIHKVPAEMAVPDEAVHR